MEAVVSKSCICPLTGSTSVRLPAPLTANRHRQKNEQQAPVNSNLGLAEIIPVIQPKAKAAGSSSDLDKLQYLRQDKPEVCSNGSGKSGNTHGN